MALRWLDRHDRPAPIYLHIGGPSTGTTYLQKLLTANGDTLAENGYPAARGRVGATSCSPPTTH